MQVEPDPAQRKKMQIALVVLGAAALAAVLVTPILSVVLLVLGPGVIHRALASPGVDSPHAALGWHELDARSQRALRVLGCFLAVLVGIAVLTRLAL